MSEHARRSHLHHRLGSPLGRRRRRQPPGTSPGTVQPHPESPSPVISVIAYGVDRIETHEDVRDLEFAARLAESWSVVWINVDGLGDADAIRRLGGLFDLHRLVLEDVVNVHQRPKVEAYDGLRYVVSRMPDQRTHAETEQVSMLLVGNVLITFQERSGDCFDPVRERLRHGRGRLRRAGADYLLYALLDVSIDAYFPLLETLGERIERLEERVLTEHNPDVIREVYVLRRRLLAMRRVVWPMREATQILARDEDMGVEDETRIYFRDCYDHCVQLLDIVETSRELTTSLMDVYLSNVSNRLNDIMKVLTIFAAIFIPLGFLAGLYGMNFDTMPELHWRYSYPAVLLVMAAVAVSLLVFFRRRGWIGAASSLPRDSTAHEETSGDSDERP